MERKLPFVCDFSTGYVFQAPRVMGVASIEMAVRCGVARQGLMAIDVEDIAFSTVLAAFVAIEEIREKCMLRAEDDFFVAVDRSFFAIQTLFKTDVADNEYWAPPYHRRKTIRFPRTWKHLHDELTSDFEVSYHSFALFECWETACRSEMLSQASADQWRTWADIFQIVCEPVSNPVCESVCDSVCEPVCESVCESVSKPVCEPVSKPVCEPREVEESEEEKYDVLFNTD
jgi:hypothetical protein